MALTVIELFFSNMMPQLILLFISRNGFFDNIVAVLDWPAKSHDLKMIANAWTWIMINVHQGQRQIDRVNDLCEAIIDA